MQPLLFIGESTPCSQTNDSSDQEYTWSESDTCSDN